MRCARGRVRDVVVDLRRRSPTFGSGRASSSTTLRPQLWIPIGFGHGFCVLSDVADFVYKCTAYYDGAPRRGSDSTTPTSASSGRKASSSCTPSATAPPRGSPRSPTTCRSDTRREGGRPLRPQPDRHAAPRQPAHRPAGVAVRARARALPRPDGRPGSGPRDVRVGHGAAQDLRAIGLDWDGEVLFQSARHEAYDAAIERLHADGRTTSASARARRSAPPPPRPWPLPEGAYPGTCLRLTDGERRRKRAGGRRRRCGCAPTRRGSASRTGCSVATRRSSTTSCSAATTAPRLQPRGHGRRRGSGHRRGRPRRRPARLDPAPGAARAAARAPEPSWRTCRSCSAATGRAWPSATAR